MSVCLRGQKCIILEKKAKQERKEHTKQKQYTRTRPTRNRRMPVSRDCELHLRLKLFPFQNNCVLIAQYWLIPGTLSGMIYLSRITCITIELKQIDINLYTLTTLVININNTRHPTTQTKHTQTKHTHTNKTHTHKQKHTHTNKTHTQTKHAHTQTKTHTQTKHTLKQNTHTQTKQTHTLTKYLYSQTCE